MKFFTSTPNPERFISLSCLILALLVFSPPCPALSQAGPLQPPDARRTPVQKDKTPPAPSSREETRVSEHLFGLAGLKNVGRIAPGVYRGAQPAPEGYATLKKMGIKTVINLRTTLNEKRAVEAAGMKSVEIPMGMFNNGDLHKVDKIVAIMADPPNRPVFVHCKLGKDRTGIVVAVYRMKMEGWPPDLAEAEMESFGFNGIWINLRHFLHRYAAGLAAGKRDRMVTVAR